MGRIRTIKPEFNSDEDLSALSCQAHLLAEALLGYCDDEGYFNANPGLVRANTCPLRGDFQNISGMLRELSGIGYIKLGVGADGKRYGQVVHFLEHQRISHPTPSKINKMEIQWEDSAVPPENSGASAEGSAQPPHSLRPEGKGKEGNGTGNGEGESARGAQDRPAPVLVQPGDDPDDEERDLPDDLPDPQLGIFLLEHLSIPWSFNLAQRFASTASLIARDEHCERSEAARRLLSRARDHPPENGKWRFWLEDGGWKENEPELHPEAWG